MAGIEPQTPDLRDRLDHFKRDAGSGTRQSLMVAEGGLILALIEGELERALKDAECALSLAKEELDPIAHTGLLSAYSYALILNCRYEESLAYIEAQTRIAESCGIEFPVGYAQLNRARALIGMRRFGPAARILSMLEREMKNEPGEYFRRELPVQRARLYVSVGDLERASDVLSLGPFEHTSRTGRGEFLGWQALICAAADEFGRAHRLAAEARVASRGLEARTLFFLAEAIAALGGRDTATATSRVQAVIDSEIWDPVVMAIRVAPAIGSFIAGEASWRGWLQRLLFASSDRTLASRLGLRVPRAAKRRAELTPRETEVHELVAQGLTNEEIARLLFISLSTTKVHVKHIYDKLGVRSRLEAARALREDV